MARAFPAVEFAVKALAPDATPPNVVHVSVELKVLVTPDTNDGDSVASLVPELKS
jgi:hypothetical protein